MSWRVVVVSNSAKLDYQMGYMVVRQEKTTKIFLNEISVVLLETTAISITGTLLSELVKNKIKVIFCDEKRNPCSELMPYYGSHDTSAKIRTQIAWTEDIKTAVWTEIVTEKIRKQMELLYHVKRYEEAELLQIYIDELQFGDATNREGHAAKVYFNALFGKDFTRTADLNINAACGIQIFIIINVKQFLNETQIVELYKIISYSKINLVLIEFNTCGNRFSQEDIYILDVDDCIITY